MASEFAASEFVASPDDALLRKGKNIQAETGPRFVLGQIRRTLGFWSRVSSIYTSYKVTQLRESLLKARGVPQDRINEQLWEPQHETAGTKMHSLCIDLRGFYLKAGQFIGARSDFVPEAWCRKLAVLHDQVPPMAPHQTRVVLQQELGDTPLHAVFEWIDLDTPLGSASVSQVHKAKLRSSSSSSGRRSLAEGEEAVWPVDVETLPAVVAARQALHSGRPKDGVVAVKVQYPDAERTMRQDMGNLRLAAYFLQRTELSFDLVSAVDELSGQLKLEFDFQREARVMDAVSKHLMSTCKNVIVPRSVPGLVTRRMLVMEFLDGTPITRLEEKTKHLSDAVKRKAKQRIMSNVSEAYGRMLLLNGLFQADGHPGNILAMKGGKIGLLDYGQSKKLPDVQRLAFAHLILAMNRGDADEVSSAMWGLGIVTDKDDAPLRSTMATNMFDTKGKIDAWSPDSPLRQSAISTFPKDLFFVLRVTQLLRGMSNGMGLFDFSCTQQWKPWATQAISDARKGKHPEVIQL